MVKVLKDDDCGDLVAVRKVLGFIFDTRFLFLRDAH